MQSLGLYPFRCGGLSLRERITTCAEVGFTHLACAHPEELEDRTADGFLALAKEFHMPIDNVHLTGSGTSKIWYEGEEGDEIIARYAREMELALDAGIDIGVVHVTWGFAVPPLNELGLSRLEGLIRHAERIGFRIAFENSASLPHYAAVFDRWAGSRAVCFAFDTGHHNEFCPDADIYDRWQHLMRVTHIDDNDGVQDLHIIPFDGTADFAKIAHALKGQERLTFEVSGLSNKKLKFSREETEANFSRLAIAGSEFVRVDDEKFHFYEGLGYRGYLERLMAAGVRLREMIAAS